MTDVAGEELIDAYLHEVGKGVLPCLLLGKFCALQPRPRPHSFEELAHCTGQNAERDMHKWADAQEFMRVLPPLYHFSVMKHKRGNPDHAPALAEHVVMLPHEVFSALAEGSPELFEYLMTGPPGTLERWWSASASAAEKYPDRVAEWLRSTRKVTEMAEPSAAASVSNCRRYSCVSHIECYCELAVFCHVPSIARCRS